MGHNTGICSSTLQEGNVLVNDVFIWLYEGRHMVKDHSDDERGNPLLPHGLLFLISNKGSFVCITPTERITPTASFVTPVVEHWLEATV